MRRLLAPLPLLGILLLLNAAAAGQTDRSKGPEVAVVSTEGHEVRFQRAADGRYRMTTRVRQGKSWRPLFNSDVPLVQGREFDLRPSSCDVLQPGRHLRLSGTHPGEGYPWRLDVEAQPPFIRFRLTCDLRKPLTLSGLEPQFAFWMEQPGVALSVDQGPAGIYQGTAEKEWGNSFPAAYLWDGGREAAVFFNMGPMTWMSHRNLFRFRDCRVQAFSEGSRTGFGLRVVRRNFHEIPAGSLAFDAYLYAGERPERPSKLEGLDRLVRLCAPLHPRSARLPTNHQPPYRARWEDFARGVAQNLMLKDVVRSEITLPPDQPWRDLPLFPEDTVSRLPISSDYAVESACDARFNRRSVHQAWDFSTCNNYLSGWIGYERLHPDAEQHALLQAKVSALPLFFDPRAGLMRHSTRYPAHVGDREMSWQNLMFTQEMLRVHRVLPAEAFRPAVAGRFLMAADGLIRLAHNTDYLLPQWFDPYLKKPMVQNDEPDLGIIHEPWQVGTYAYLMEQAHALTGDGKYLAEARTGLDRLFGGMRFATVNRRYRVDYTDPVDFPVTEIFGNAWGVAAAARLYHRTGDPKYRRYSDHFLNSLLRMTYWYESELREDERDRLLRNAGLFRNQGGAYTGSPWETGEAYLALTVRLKLDPEVREPLLRLFNLQRVNGFYYFPAVFSGAAVPCRKLQEHPARYLPIEDTYTHEHGGANGGMGRCVYMSGLAFWNYLMYEAFAGADRPEWMVLNLDAADGFDSAAASQNRHFLVYNGGDTASEARVRMRSLAPGSYRLTLRRAPNRRETRTLTGASLASGISLRLDAEEHVRLELERLDPSAARVLQKSERARDGLARAYQRLQQAAEHRGVEPLAAARRLFREAEAAYRDRQWDRASDLAGRSLRSASGETSSTSKPVANRSKHHQNPPERVTLIQRS